MTLYVAQRFTYTFKTKHFCGVREVNKLHVSRSQSCHVSRCEAKRDLAIIARGSETGLRGCEEIVLTRVSAQRVREHYI
jgi:hypothetical protein